MRLLIDSHSLIWWAEASPALSATAHDAIADPANDILVSAAALWELAIKVSSGKLGLRDDLEVMLTNLGFAVLPIGFAHLRRISTLQRAHRDPFDRMMIAQALAESIPIVTRDRIFASCGVQVIW